MGKWCWFLFLILCLAGCQPQTRHEPHSHTHDSHDSQHAHNGHDSHDSHHAHDGHGEEESRATQVTLWDEEVELFLEYPPIAVDEPVRLITHVTYLEGWSPRAEGALRLKLSQDGELDLELSAEVPDRDGIYLPQLIFPKAGIWKIEVAVPLEDGESTQAFAVEVYPSRHDAQHAPPSEEHADITFLKEQQWRMAFATEVVAIKPFRESLRANGVITPRAGGEVVVHAPVDGRLRTTTASPLHMGDRVTRGQRLASLIPRLDEAQDPAVLTLALRKAELARDFAQKEWVRVNGLFQKDVLAESRLRQAELDLEIAEAELRTAKARFQQYAAAEKGSDQAPKAGLELYAPLAGTLIETHHVAGALVTEGDKMFEIIDLENVWLQVEVPEGDIGRVTDARAAWFKVDGLDDIFEVNDQSGGGWVALGGKIEPHRRTVPLIFEVPNDQGLLKIGMFAEVFVLSDKVVKGPSVPLSCLIEEAGQTICYVQIGGESFERRVLELGLKDGNRVEVRKGVTAGERVVSKGAYQLRLASASKAVPGHGHAH